MPRFYHISDVLMGRLSGTAGMALPIAGDDPTARAVVLRSHNSLGFAPVATGTQGTITISLSMEGR